MASENVYLVRLFQTESIDNAVNKVPPWLKISRLAYCTRIGTQLERWRFTRTVFYIEDHTQMTARDVYYVNNTIVVSNIELGWTGTNFVNYFSNDRCLLVIGQRWWRRTYGSTHALDYPITKVYTNVISMAALSKDVGHQPKRSLS